MIIPTKMLFNPSSAGVRIFGDNQDNTIAADALAPFIAKASAAMVLIMQDSLVLVFHREGFHYSIPSQCQEIIENANVFLYFLYKKKEKKLQHVKG